MSTDLLKASGLVTFNLLVDGAEPSIPLKVESILVTKEVNKIPFARIVMNDGDVTKGEFEVSSSNDFVPGKELTIQAGYDSENEDIFKGIIIKHALKIRNNGHSVLILECRDPAIKMTIDRKSDYFYESKDSDIIEEIAGTYGLTTDVEATDVEHKEMVQFQCTDWDFIMNRAEVNGKILIASDGELKVLKPDLSGSSVTTITYGQSLIEFEAEIDASMQLAGTKGISWDPAGQALLEEEGEDPGISGLGNLSPSTLAEVTAPETLALRHGGKIPDTELKAWADARYLRSGLSQARGRIKTHGLSGIKQGDIITLEGLGDRFNGDAFVSSVRHELSEGNWTMDLELGISPEWFTEMYGVSSPPAAGIIPGITGLQIGIVKQVREDPDGEYRILVACPAISAEKEGIWARIALADAGSERGIFFLPEIDDEVVVGFLNEDPRHAVILGMLHSSAKAAPLEATDDNIEKGIITKSGIKVLFNDEDPSLLIETPGGNKLTISDKDEGIELADQNDNKILMNADGITLESAADLIFKASGDIKTEGTNVETTASGDAKLEGTNIEFAASAEFKADGGAGAELTTGAIAVVKGSMVQIN